ncbi:MAG: sugar transferase, partial [Erysipelotrichia bacterium]|nr:sugar transferase [Erysipelotrichia bacterium]
MSGKLKHDKLVDAVKVLDLVLMVMPFVISWLLYYSGKTAAPYYRNGQVFLILLYSILYFSYCKLYGGFLVSLFRISEIIYSQALAALFSNAIIYIVLILLSKKLPSIIPLLIVFACQIALASIWAKAANEWYFRKFPPLNCIVIYDERIHIADLIESYGMKKKFKITRVITAEDCLKDMSILDETEAVFMTDVIGRGRNEILIHCVEKKIDVYTIPNIGDLIMSGARAIHLFHLPMLRVGDVSANKEFTIIKRTFDILISSLCLVI